MSQLVGHVNQLGWVALKAILLFGVALVGFRVGGRRTLAQLRPFDFVVSVALGAIIGRTATSNTTSFVTGAGALVALLVAHRVVAQARRRWRVLRVADDRPEVLVLQGALQAVGMTRAGLTDSDVYSMLRQQGVGDLAEVDVLIFEPGGGISLHRAGSPRGPLMVHALRASGLSE